MIYLKVPAVIFRSIQKVLDLYGEKKNIRWLQMDFKEDDVKPHVNYKDGKLIIENNEANSDAFKILQKIIRDLYENANQ